MRVPKNKKLSFIVPAILIVAVGLFLLNRPDSSDEKATPVIPDTVAGALDPSLPSSRAAAQEVSTAQWSVRCDEATSPEGGGHCEIFQRLDHAQSGKRVVEFAIGFQPETDAARGIIVLPLGILLPPGVLIQVDDGASFKSQIRSCTQKGCVARVVLNAQLLEVIGQGTTLSLTMKMDDGKNLVIKMSLAGFAAALAEISK